MASTIDPILYSGSWTDPDTGLITQQDLTRESADEYIAWTGGFLAAINSGLFDKVVYEIAAQCHQRHLAMVASGVAPTITRPARPAKLAGGNMSTLPIDMNAMPRERLLSSAAITPLRGTISARTKTFGHAGNQYAQVNLRGKFFKAPHSFAPDLQGIWFRIEGFGVDHFQCRIVTLPLPSSTVKMGQLIQIKFESVNFLFTV